MHFLKVGFLALIVFRLAMKANRVASGDFQPFSWNREDFGVHVQRHKGRVVGVSLRIALHDTWRFVLRRETAFDRTAKYLGVASEWQTGDPRFDERVFILSEDLTLHRALTRDQGLREAALQLLERRGAILECKAGYLYCYFPFQPEKEDRKLHEEIGKIGALFPGELQKLLGVRDALQRVRATRWQPDERDPALTTKSWLAGICVTLAMLGLLGFFLNLGEDRSQVVREAIPRLATLVAVSVTSALLLATLVWLRSTSHTHAVLLDVLLMAGPGCWMAANYSATVYNQHFDRHGAQHVPVRVQSVDVKRGKGTRYYLNVERWPDPRASLRVKIRADEYRWMQYEGCVTATWHRGRLGDGWVAGYERGCETGAQVER